MFGVAEILSLIIERVPDALAAFQSIRSTLGTHEQVALDAQLAAVQRDRHAADDALDALLRAKGL